MKDHVPGVVVEGEVVFGQGGLAGVEGGLVAEGVVTVAQGGSHVDYGAEHTRDYVSEISEERRVIRYIDKDQI